VRIKLGFEVSGRRIILVEEAPDKVSGSKMGYLIVASMFSAILEKFALWRKSTLRWPLKAPFQK
jgi:hypothetical protein